MHKRYQRHYIPVSLSHAVDKKIFWQAWLLPDFSKCNANGVCNAVYYCMWHYYNVLTSHNDTWKQVCDLRGQRNWHQCQVDLFETAILPVEPSDLLMQCLYFTRLASNFNISLLSPLHWKSEEPKSWVEPFSCPQDCPLSGTKMVPHCPQEPFSQELYTWPLNVEPTYNPKGPVII